MKFNTITEAEIKGLNVQKIFNNDSTETLLITLEKGSLFPKHTSPKETLLVVLEGSIHFFIQDQTVKLDQHQVYRFNKNIEHHVTANENSKFLIIR